MAIKPQSCDSDVTINQIDPIPVCFDLSCETDSITVCNTGATLNDGVEFPVSLVAVQIMPANPTRKKLIVQNTGTANLRVGNSTVTANTGTRLVPNGSMIIDMPDVPTNSIWAIRESGVDTVAFAQDIS